MDGRQQTYIDEARTGKDVPVAEALAGQVFSGVGTCHCRAVTTIVDGDGCFDAESD